MANTPSDDEIIEKRPSHPVATSCLILAAATMLGGIIFQVAEISQVRAGMSNLERSANEPQKKLYERNIKDFKDRVDKVYKDNDHPEILGTEAADGKAPAGSAEGTAEEKAAPAAAPDRAAPPKETPAEGTADEKPAEEKAPDETPEEKAAEPPAEEKAPEPPPAEPAPTEKAEGDAPAPEEPAPAGDEPKEEK